MLWKPDPTLAVYYFTQMQNMKVRRVGNSVGGVTAAELTLGFNVDHSWLLEISETGDSAMGIVIFGG